MSLSLRVSRRRRLAPGLDSIGKYAFQRSGIRVVDFRNTRLRFIGDHCFSDCGLLTELHVPGTLRDIGDECFVRTKLTIVNLSHCMGLQRIGVSAFHSCFRLSQVMLPVHAFTLYGDVFYGSRLRGIEICSPPVCYAHWAPWYNTLPLHRLVFLSAHGMGDQRTLQCWVGEEPVVHSGTMCVATCNARPISPPS
jgi:hypothetical protein